MNNYYDSHSLQSTAQWRDIAYSDHSLTVVCGLLQNIRREHFRPEAKLRWVDVGCGLGRNALVAKKLGFSYTGIDSSARHVEACRAAYPGETFVCEDWLAHSGRYDVVTFISSLHHFPDWRAALKKAFELVDAGGVVMVDHEANRFFAALFRFYSVYIRRIDVEVIGKVEIHWLAKPSILPEELPPGETQYHWDYFPLLGRLGIRTKWKPLGRFFESYRKIMVKL